VVDWHADCIDWYADCGGRLYRGESKSRNHPLVAHHEHFFQQRGVWMIMSPNDPDSGSSSHSFPSDSGDSKQLPAIPAHPQTTAVGLPMAGAPWPFMQESGEGINLVAFLHALRRRWLVGGGVGIVIATLIAALLWFLIPVNFEAVALLRVRQDIDPIISGPGAPGPTDVRRFEIFKQTQRALLKGPYVVTAALRRPGISQLSMVRRERGNEVTWLSDELSVVFPGDSEIMQISMKGEDPKELTRLVNAVKDAYMDEIVFAMRTEQTVKLDVLKRAYQRNTNDVKRELKVVGDLRDQVGSGDSRVALLNEELALSELTKLKRLRDDLEMRLYNAETQIALVSTARDMSDFRVSEYAIEDALLLEPEYFEAKQAVSDVEREYQAVVSAGARQGSPELAAVQSRMMTATGALDRVRAELKPRIVERLRRSYGIDEFRDEQAQLLHGTERRILTKRLAEVVAAYEKQEEVVRQTRGWSADLLARENELLSLQEMGARMKAQIDSLELNLERSSRIELLQEAIVPDESDWYIKWIEIGALWAIVLCVTLLGIAYWDYQGKRVNSTKDVPSGAGIPVVGSLPMLRGSRLGLWPFGQIDRRSLEIALNYSIDSIRAALLYSKTTTPRKLVMITSAHGQEGKSTVASQLAVSLARSGRRTLLVDGDIRNPQQHAVFGMALDRGFCELARSEATPDDVIQPTSVEGLWMIGAGYCDKASIQALSDESMHDKFEDLKARFDFVVLDAGPVLTGADPLLLGQHSDTSVLSVRCDFSKIPKVSEACDRLRSVGIHILGAVVNGAAAEIRRNELELITDASTDANA